MKLLFIGLFLFWIEQCISPFVAIPEKLETEPLGNKGIHNISFTFRRRNRNSPYYLDFNYYATIGYGNNLSIKWTLNEYLSGHYVQLPMQFDYKLCDFLYKDKFFGKMYAEQLRGNWSCPFPPGESVFTNLVMHAENLPLIPFTYSSLIVRVRINLLLYWIPYEEIATVKIYLKLIQKLKKDKA